MGLRDFPLAAQMNAKPLSSVETEENGSGPVRSYADVLGKKFGKLTYKAPAPDDEKRRGRCALFSCDCGGQRVAEVSQVKNGLVKSCGCMRGQRRQLQVGVAPARQKRTKPVPELPMPHQPQVEPEQQAIAVDDRNVIANFRAEIIDTGRDIAALVHQARKVSPEQVAKVIAEIRRVAQSPFASIPDGALEEAEAVLAFIEGLRVIAEAAR